MHYSALVSAFLASVAVAIPLEENPFPGATKWTTKYQVQPGDVIVPIKDTGKSPVLCLTQMILKVP